MSEKITFEIGTMENASFVEGLIFYGDERGEDYPKWRLTNLEGWDMPNYERISVPDPNGGNYVDSHITKLGKIVTLNFSVFFKKDSDGFDALKKCAEDFASEDLRTLRRITEFSESIVEETLDECYKINEIGVVKKTGEYRFTISFGSTNYDVVTKVIDKTTPPVEPINYDGLYLGEASTAENPVGTGFFWDGVSNTWVETDPTTNPSYHAGVDYGEVGTEVWNLGLTWEPRSSKWWNYPVPVSKLNTDGYEMLYGEWVWGLYQGLYARGYYDPQNKKLTTVDVKNLPSYYDGTTHGQKGTESWNDKLWWNTNLITASWVSYNPGPDLGPRDGSKGTYHGEFRARWTQGDNVYWDSGLKNWSTANPLLDPMYAAGTQDKQELLTPYGPIYWNINIGAYQSMNEFFASRGEYPAPRSSSPGDYHGQEAIGEGLFWDSMNQLWSTTDWTKDPAYYAGIDNGEPSPENFAFFLYWNENINYYQSEQEYRTTNGYYPFEKQYQ